MQEVVSSEVERRAKGQHLINDYCHMQKARQIINSGAVILKLV